MSEASTRLAAAARLAALYLLVGVMLVLARPTPGGVAAGATCVALGEALRVWAAGHLVKNDRLATAGPYRWVRNPLYLGRLLIFLGLCLMARLPHGAHWVVLVAGLAVFFGYYLPRKERVEPARLLALHGETFARYRREVPALFPLRRPWSAGEGERWSWPRALRNREHWMVLALTGITLFLFLRA